ncbi:glutamate-gated chloride channel-like [Amblyomma americanum]
MAFPRNASYLKPAVGVAILFVLLHGANAQKNFYSYVGRVLNDIFKPEKYDRQVRPAGTNESTGPVIVTTNLFVRSINDIDDHEMAYSVQLTFRQKWKDERLKYNDLNGQLRYLNLDTPSKLWLPDPFFSNELTGSFHNIMQPNVLVRIYPDGTVLYSTRISLRLSCPMNLKNFPFDRQACPLNIASYGYTTEDIVFLWKEGDPVQVTRNLHLLKFTLTKFMTDYCTARTNTGEYSCLRLDFVFERERRVYMVNVCIPCVMLVLLSWVTLWVSNKNTVVRIFVPLIVLLVAATFVGKQNQELLPHTSYTKAMDVWTGVCLTFLFILVLYVATVDYTARALKRSGQQASPASAKDDTRLEEDTGKAAPGSSESTSFRHVVKAWIQRPKSLPDKMDVVARIAFPLCFCLFLIIYFSVHAGSSADD